MAILQNCPEYHQYRAQTTGSSRLPPANITAVCTRSSQQGKRSVDGTFLKLTFTFSEQVPLNCDTVCLDNIAWNLFFAALDLEARIASETLLITLMDLSSLVENNVTLNNALTISPKPQKNCNTGSILSADEQFCCKFA